MGNKGDIRWHGISRKGHVPGWNAARPVRSRRAPGWKGFLRSMGVALALAVCTVGAHGAHRSVLVVGDSLSAEYGLARGSGWVKLLADRVAAEAPEYSVVNASISGDTTSGGRTRLPPLLAQSPAVVVIELGANDGLRGLSVDAMRANLQAMVQECRHHGAKVLLVGMHVPPNYGQEYADRFYGVYTGLAQSDHVALAPFLLDGFADQLQWFQPDHIHPLASAQGRMLDNVWPYLAPLLRPDGSGR